MGVNGVPVAPHGLMLGENEAAPSRNLVWWNRSDSGIAVAPESQLGGEIAARIAESRDRAGIA